MAMSGIHIKGEIDLDFDKLGDEVDSDSFKLRPQKKTKVGKIPARTSSTDGTDGLINQSLGNSNAKLNPRQILAQLCRQRKSEEQEVQAPHRTRSAQKENLQHEPEQVFSLQAVLRLAVRQQAAMERKKEDGEREALRELTNNFDSRKLSKAVRGHNLLLSLMALLDQPSHVAHDEVQFAWSQVKSLQDLLDSQQAVVRKLADDSWAGAVGSGGKRRRLQGKADRSEELTGAIMYREEVRRTLMQESRSLIEMLDPLDPSSFSSLLVEYKQALQESARKIETLLECGQQQDDAPATSPPTTEEFRSQLSEAATRVSQWLDMVSQRLASCKKERRSIADRYAGCFFELGRMLQGEGSLRSLKEASKLHKAIVEDHLELEKAFLCEEEVFTDSCLIQRFPYERIWSLLPYALSWINGRLYCLDHITDVQAVQANLAQLRSLQDPQPILETCDDLQERLEDLNDKHSELLLMLRVNQRKELDCQEIEEKLKALRRDKVATARELEQLEQVLWKLFLHYPEYSSQVRGSLDVDVGGHERMDMFELISRLSMAGQRGARHNVLHVRQEEEEFVIKEFSLSEDPRDRRHFLKEASILRRLKHPYLMTLCSAFTEEHREHGPREVKGYLKMPFLLGGSLSSWMKRVRPGRIHRQRVLMQVLQGLEHLRQNRIIHGDIKPDNILMSSVDEHAEPKIADFDVSKEQEDRARDLVATVTATHVVGTLQYLAPELLLPTTEERRASHKSDMYAYGIVMTEVLAETSQDVEQDSSSLVLAGGNQEAIDLIGRLQSSDPQQRPSSAEALTHPYFYRSTIREMEQFEKQQKQKHEEHERMCAELLVRQEKLREQERCVTARRESLRTDERQLLLQRKEMLERGKELEADDKRRREQLQKARKELDELEAQVNAQQEQVLEDLKVLRRGEADLEQERKTLTSKKLLLGNHRAVLDPPLYWQHVSVESLQHTSTKVDVTREWREKIQELMTSTCKQQCIGRGRNNRGCTHKGFLVDRVFRVEDKNLWSAYALQRKSIGNSMMEQGKQHPTSAVSTWRDWMREELLGDQLSNEVFLFHGTQHEVTDVILSSGYGLDERVSKLSGHLGAGVYLAENSSKSDEYCTPDADGLCCMFLVRAALGSPYETTAKMTNQRRPPAGSDSRLFDSVIALTRETHPGSFLQWHREFVVYDRRQAYPEFLIQYRRV